MENKILVVDDNKEIREVIRVLFESEGFSVLEAGDGEEALEVFKSQRVDLIILDIMMPRLDGYKTCMEIRKTSYVPILFLTARTEESDKAFGFSTGADDYLVKPFSYTEIVARVKALLRRCYTYQAEAAEEAMSEHCIQISDLVINLENAAVSVGGREIDLTDTEYNILVLLAKNRKKIFSVESIYEAVWKETYYHSANNTVMVHIRKLRIKIERDPQNPRYIKTVWGRGYKID